MHGRRHDTSSRRSSSLPPTPLKLATANLFIDDDALLKVEARITEGTQLSHDEKNPVIFPDEWRLAHLYIPKYEIVSHGPSEALRFSIQTVKTVLLHCRFQPLFFW